MAQGKKFIDEQYPEAQIEVTASTAYAARFISEHPDQPFAAIAPRSSAEEYGLELIAEDIQEMEANFTRFWLLGAEKPSIPLQAQTEKMSLALTLPDNLPGALYKALSTFAWRGIDLTKLKVVHSRQHWVNTFSLSMWIIPIRTWSTLPKKN